MCFTTPLASPLSIQIHKELIKLEQDKKLYSETEIRNFLKVYTRSRKYRDSLIVGANRLNLDGSTSSLVTEKEIPSNYKSTTAEGFRRKRKYLKTDAFIKGVLQEEVAAIEFLNEYLQDDLKGLLDLSSVNVESESFVEENLTRRLSDIIYSVKTKEGKDAYIYILIEAQTSPDKYIALRIMKYNLLLLERHASKKEEFPLIANMVIYNGRKVYDAPLNLWNLFQNPVMAKELISGDYRLINLNNMEDDEIIKQKHLALVSYVMKHIHTRDMLKLLKTVFEKLQPAILIDETKDFVYIKKILWYIGSKLPEDKQEELVSFVSSSFVNEKTKMGAQNQS